MTLISTYRTNTCGELRAEHIDSTVTLSGWIHRKRDHGGIVFVDLRDNYGVTQIVFANELGEEVQKLRLESVIQVKGKVLGRAKAVTNERMKTGAIEVHAETLTVHSHADILPFQISEEDNAPEVTRLKYRFLELRRDDLHDSILLRSRVIRAIREIMHEQGFSEFQTPILTSSSPEGARDFLVPSRFHPGKFFALPQAPQQFKQLLMVAGFDRYFQIAPCFRDEDPRADRSPGEFYQCDLEMSFVEQEDVFTACEHLFHTLFTRFTTKTVTGTPFPRIRYNDALSLYGTDKPDLRNPLVISDVSSVFGASAFKVFQNELALGGGVFAIKVEVPSLPSRKYFDETIEFFKELQGQGLAYLTFDGEGHKGSIAKFVSDGEVASLRSTLQIGSSPTIVFLGAGGHDKILPSLGKLRTRAGSDFNLIEKDSYRFCWITDFPMYERNPDTGAIEFSHNPFSMPQGGMEALETKNPLDIYAYQYDVVCNGYELSSGAIRNHKPEIMYKAFEIAGYTSEHVDEKFGGMIRAFKFGAPPHGGMAPGIDRIVMLLAGKETIREVIAFPLSQTVEDLMMGAPSTVSFKQLRETHIRLSEALEVMG